VITILLLSEAAGFGSVSFGVEQRTTQLLIKAMKARDAGRLEQAEVYWHQARTFKPGLKRPAWLDRMPEPEPPMRNLQEMLITLDNLSYKEAREILLARIEISPGNTELRKKLLELAIEAGDVNELRRQKDFLGIKDKESSFMWLRWLLLISVVGLVIWQLSRFWQEWRAE
jgi:hypothetical protein